MGYKLRWNDNNLSEDGHRIYRSTSPMDPENLPAPLALVGPDVTEFEDTTAEEDVVYFYRVSAFKGASEAVSLEAQSDGEGGGTDPGPGPGGLPDTIGQEFGGGYYIGNISVLEGPDAGEYAIIMGGPDSQVSAQWKDANTATPDTDSYSNGRANTLAMDTAGLAAHPAAAHCLGFTGGGFNDWYLPAANELGLAWINRVELAGLAMDSQYYWSSTQYSAGGARRQSFSSGSKTSLSKNYYYRVRPVRRLKT